MWDPSQYERFADARLRPGLELLSHVRLDNVATVVDLGCGTGALLGPLRQRFPRAHLIGVDNAPEMLAQAVGADALIEVDITEWEPAAPVDLLFSNAALHWLDRHDVLLPRLLKTLRPGGQLAVQMPRNHDRPSHRLIAEVVRGGPWRDRLEPILVPREWPVLQPAEYWGILTGHVQELDMWEVDYIQPLDGPDPVAEWTKGSALRPFLAALDEVEGARFFERYRALVAEAYPPGPDGHTLLSFRRLFFIATR